jgi:hypothetical protein
LPPLAEIASDELTFVCCIEGTAIEAQALLLCESIRRFGGRYAKATVVAVNPRPSLPISYRSEQQLADLDVRYVCEPLNVTGSPYLTINRIVTGSWAEQHLGSAYVAVLDSDMLFVRPPSFTRADVGIRPVDAKGSASAGPDDPLDAYWSSMCAIAGIAADALPLVRASIDGTRLRASYNGGFCIARRSLGVFRETHRVFEVSRERDLRPLRGSALSVYASTGFVGDAASEWWGSSQAALSVAIHARARSVEVYDARYNVPLHLLAPGAGGSVPWPARAPVLLHYHWLTAPEHRSELFVRLHAFDIDENVVSWLHEFFEREQTRPR